MQELSYSDKFTIFDIQNISSQWLVGQGRKTMFFEYLADLSGSVMYDIIKEANLDFQIKIVKESYSMVKDKILSEYFLDFTPVQKKREEKYNIIINDDSREEFSMKRLEESVLDKYVSDNFIYRHYLIINFPSKQKIDVDIVIYDILLKAADKNVSIRVFDKEDIKEYLFNAVNFPTKIGESFSEFASDFERKISIFDEVRENKWNHALRFIGSINNTVWQISDKVLNVIENIFYHRSVSNITTEIADIFSQRMFKGENFIRIGNNYQGAIVTRGVPKENFNILKFLFRFLQVGDNVVINLYPPERYRISDINSNLSGVDKVYGKGTKDITFREGESFLQMIICFNDDSPFLLNKRINQFQLDIGSDFYTQRIESVMSHCMESMLAMGINTLKNERSFSDERLKANLLF